MARCHGDIETIKQNLPLRDEANLERTSKGVRQASRTKREARASKLRDDSQARSVADLARSRYRAPRVTTSIRSQGAHNTFRQNERDRASSFRQNPSEDVPQFLQSFVAGRDPFTPDPRDRNPVEPSNRRRRRREGCGVGTGSGVITGATQSRFPPSIVTFIVYRVKKTLLYGRLPASMRSKEYSTSQEHGAARPGGGRGQLRPAMSRGAVRGRVRRFQIICTAVKKNSHCPS